MIPQNPIASTVPGSQKAKLAAFAAIQKKAENVKILDLKGKSSFTDYFMICSGMTDRQVRAIAESIEAEAKKFGLTVLSVEGLEDCRWVLIDLGDVVAHVFIDAVRDFYDLEKLWVGSPKISIPENYYLHTSTGFPDQLSV